MRVLKPVKDYKARHASTMLTFDAVVDCLDQIAAQQPEAVSAATVAG
jgi:NifU-like protein involved in Fe-S cluster formation